MIQGSVLAKSVAACIRFRVEMPGGGWRKVDDSQSLYVESTAVRVMRLTPGVVAYHQFRE